MTTTLDASGAEAGRSPSEHHTPLSRNGRRMKVKWCCRWRGPNGADPPVAGAPVPQATKSRSRFRHQVVASCVVTSAAGDHVLRRSTVSVPACRRPARYAAGKLDPNWTPSTSARRRKNAEGPGGTGPSTVGETGFEPATARPPAESPTVRCVPDASPASHPSPTSDGSSTCDGVAGTTLVQRRRAGSWRRATESTRSHGV